MSQSKTVYEEVKEMLERGYTIDQINKITGYDEEYIQGVQEDIENGIA
jgi:flagellar biosynthesis chaperone FliJ